MKKFVSMMLAVVMLVSFGVFALGSGESEDGGDVNQGSGAADTVNKENGSTLGDYSVIIDSCRLAKDYEDEPVVIVKYKFTNEKDDDSASFMLAITDNVYQNGVGLNKAYILDDSANYNSDNQSKEIKKGASIEVEVAYELNDTETDIEVEVKELISLSDKKIVKTFSIK